MATIKVKFRYSYSLCASGLLSKKQNVPNSDSIICKLFSYQNQVWGE